MDSDAATVSLLCTPETVHLRLFVKSYSCEFEKILSKTCNSIEPLSLFLDRNAAIPDDIPKSLID